MIRQDERMERPAEGERDRAQQPINRRLEEIEQALRELEEKLGQ